MFSSPPTNNRPALGGAGRPGRGRGGSQANQWRSSRQRTDRRHMPMVQENAKKMACCPPERNGHMGCCCCSRERAGQPQPCARAYVGMCEVASRDTRTHLDNGWVREQARQRGPQLRPQRQRVHNVVCGAAGQLHEAGEALKGPAGGPGPGDRGHRLALAHYMQSGQVVNAICIDRHVKSPLVGTLSSISQAWRVALRRRRRRVRAGVVVAATVWLQVPDDAACQKHPWTIWLVRVKGWHV